MTLFRTQSFITTQLGLLLALLISSPALAGSGAAIEVEVASMQQAPGAVTPPPGLAATLDMTNVLLDGLEATADPATTLSVTEALDRALANHPGLDSLAKEYLALDNLAWQEGRRPNPELELELGDFGGTDDAAGFASLATTLTYSQAIERGGKRDKRVTAASLEREVLLWDIAELEHEIQGEVRQAYAAAQAAHYEVDQLQRYRNLVQHIYDTVAASVDAGRSARLELERFDVELAQLDLAVAIAERNRQQALLALAGTFGSTTVDFTAVAAVGTDPALIPALPELQRPLEDHPGIRRYSAEYQARCALVDLENANAVTDLALSGGVTQLSENGEFVFKLGVAWDLKLHDRNEGNISAAGYRLEQVADNEAATRLALETEMAALHQQALFSLVNYEAYHGQLLPAANEVLALTEEGYRYGKFELLDVLDTQRTVLELEREQATALVELHLQLAGIEALLNIDLADIAGLEARMEPAPLTDSLQTEPLAHEEHNHE